MLQGLDNFVVRGSNGIDDVKSIIDEILTGYSETVSGNEEMAGKPGKIRFIKTEYLSHVSGIIDAATTSNNIHHCNQYAYQMKGKKTLWPNVAMKHTVQTVINVHK